MVREPPTILTERQRQAQARSSFAYSIDNKSFIEIGNELNMKFNLKVFTGNKFCLFNYATKNLVDMSILIGSEQMQI